jgi:hypothetical protein
MHLREVEIYLIVTFADSYRGLLCVKGRYRCLIMCLICRFIVIQKSVMKYMTRMGQNTGTLKTSKNVHTSAMVVDLVMAYQNLNSGNRRMKGLNSSLLLVGNSGPSGSSTKIVRVRTKKRSSRQQQSCCWCCLLRMCVCLPESRSSAGSIFGVRKAMKRLR